MPSQLVHRGCDPAWPHARLLSGAQKLQHMARMGARTPTIRTIARRLHPRGGPPSPYRAVGMAWRWLPTVYVEERRGDHWQSPVQTLRRGHGDCEDWSVLLAALLLALRIDARIVTIPGHVVVAVRWPSRMGAGPWPVHRHGRDTWLLLESTFSRAARRWVIPGQGVASVVRWLGTPCLQIARR